MHGIACVDFGISIEFMNEFIIAKIVFLNHDLLFEGKKLHTLISLKRSVLAHKNAWETYKF